MIKITLTKEEKEELENYLLESKNAFNNQRVNCILLKSQFNLKTKELAEHFNATAETIYDWFWRWKKEGLAGLMNKEGQGAKLKLIEMDIEILDNLVKANAQNLKMVLETIKSEYKIEVSKKTLSRFLKKKKNTLGEE